MAESNESTEPNEGIEAESFSSDDIAKVLSENVTVDEFFEMVDGFEKDYVSGKYDRGLTFYLHKELHRRLKVLALQKDTDATSLLNGLIAGYLARQEGG